MRVLLGRVGGVLGRPRLGCAFPNRQLFPMINGEGSRFLTGSGSSTGVGVAIAWVSKITRSRMYAASIPLAGSGPSGNEGWRKWGGNYTRALR